MQNNGKGKTKKRAARANLFFAKKKKKCAARAICFFAIRACLHRGGGPQIGEVT